jgi:hypothetical protein
VTTLVPAALLRPAADAPVVSHYTVNGATGGSGSCTWAEPLAADGRGFVCDLCNTTNAARARLVLAEAECQDPADGVRFCVFTVDGEPTGWWLDCGDGGSVLYVGAPVSGLRRGSPVPVVVPALATVAIVPTDTAEALAAIVLARVPR